MNLEGYDVSTDRCDGVIFDLDGVITQTAKVHARAWKAIFDQYLEERAARKNTDFIPFVQPDQSVYLRFQGQRL